MTLATIESAILKSNALIHGSIKFQKKYKKIKNKKSRRRLIILGARMVTRGKYRSEYSEILGASIGNLFASTNWRPVFVQACFN
jgi:hypothetical protein